MRTITVTCDCCGEMYKAIITSTCGKSCGAQKREQKAKISGRPAGKRKSREWMEGFEINGVK